MPDGEPLRWIHFRDGPEGAGVYVHIADLLALIDARDADVARAELEALLEDKAGEQFSECSK